MSFLFVIRGNDQGCRFEIRETVVSIGRETSNGFQLHDPEVSRKHAEIRKSDRKDTLFDLKSSNGLFVNGKRVHSMTLHSGDQIQIGKTLLLYTKTDAEMDESSREAVNVQINADTQDPAAAIVASVPKDEGTWLFDGFSDDLADNRQSDWMKKAKGHLKMMYHTALVVSQTLDTDRLLHRIIDLIFDWVHIDRACILLYDVESKKLVPQVSRTRDSVESPAPMRISQTILDYVLNTEEGILTNDAGLDERWDPGASILAESIRDVICVPMRGRYGTIGVIYLDAFGLPGLHGEESRKADDPENGRPRRFNRDHLKLMGAIAHQAALAVEDTRYYRGMVQAERLVAVGQTVAVLSHDIKNILQGIAGGGFLIEKGLKEHNEELIAKGWEFVQKNQGLISDMVLDMLTLSKEREPSLLLEDINRITADVVELMQGRVQSLEILFHWTPDHSIPPFCFDAKQMSRAITNVLTNAIDAVAEKSDGHVEITAKLNEAFGRVEIIVDDNGPGIPEEQKDQLFRLFQTTKKGQGTGLGLSVTQKILQEHNGNVQQTNSPLGGARFILEIPLLTSDDVSAP